MPKVTVTAYPSILPKGRDFESVKNDVQATKENKARSMGLVFAIRDALNLLLPPADPTSDELFSFRCNTVTAAGKEVVLDSEMYSKLTVALSNHGLTSTAYRLVYNQVMAIVSASNLTGMLLPPRPAADGSDIAMQFSARNPALSVDPPFWGDFIYRKVDGIIVCENVGGLFPNGDGTGNPLYVGIDGFQGGAEVGIALQIRIS